MPAGQIINYGSLDDVLKYWQPLGKRFTGKGMGDIAGVLLQDINGDMSVLHLRSQLLKIETIKISTGKR